MSKGTKTSFRKWFWIIDYRQRTNNWSVEISTKPEGEIFIVIASESKAKTIDENHLRISLDRSQKKVDFMQSHLNCIQNVSRSLHISSSSSPPLSSTSCDAHTWIWKLFMFNALCHTSNINEIVIYSSARSANPKSSQSNIDKHKSSINRKLRVFDCLL